MKMKQTMAALGVALAAAITAPRARADTVTATFSNVNPGEVVTIQSTTPAVGPVQGWAGSYNFTGASGALTGNYSTFCIDIAQDIFFGQQATWNVTALANAPTPGTAMGQVRANEIAELWYNDYQYIAHPVTGTSNQNAAAFQVAIWEIINETGNNLNVSTGSFQASGDSTVTSLANSWLGGIDPTGNGPQASGLIALTSPSTQDYVVQVQAVPVPPGLVLGGVGIVCFLLPLGWRRRQRLSLPA